MFRLLRLDGVIYGGGGGVLQQILILSTVVHFVLMDLEHVIVDFLAARRVVTAAEKETVLGNPYFVKGADADTNWGNLQRTILADIALLEMPEQTDGTPEHFVAVATLVRIRRPLHV